MKNITSTIKTEQKLSYIQEEATGETGRGNPYKTNKLYYHQDVINNLRSGSNDTLIQVHLMPQNACNQRCAFCSYRMPNNKNSLTFRESKSIKIEEMEKLIKDMKEIGVKAVEVTGGGEPLLYKYKYKMFQLLFDAGFDVGLVTNGTLLDDKLADVLAPNLTWMRVSLDAATTETYCKIRSASTKQFNAALESIRKIRMRGDHKKEFRVGVGYVMTNGNELEVYEICKLAKELGADNIRLSLTFSDKQLKYFRDQEKVNIGIKQAEEAVKEIADNQFQIFNLIPERCKNILERKNNYPYCYTKDILCVIEGEGNVFTCCTFTGSTKGKLGNIVKNKEGVKGVWRDSQSFRRKLNPQKYCNVICLYQARNVQMIYMVNSNEYSFVNEDKPIHVNFI